MEMPFTEQERQDIRKYAEQLFLTYRKPALMIFNLLDQAEEWEKANIKMWYTITKIAQEDEGQKAIDIAVNFLDEVGQE